MSHEGERQRRFQEIAQRALERGVLSPEQLQMAQAALQQFGVGQPGAPAIQPPAETAGLGMQAPPIPTLSNQSARPPAMPQGYIDSLYRNALAEQQRWLAQYEKYRMQGSFTQLEPIFETIKHITKR